MNQNTINVKIVYEIPSIRHISVQCPRCGNWFNGQKIASERLKYRCQLDFAVFTCPVCHEDFGHTSRRSTPEIIEVEEDYVWGEEQMNDTLSLAVMASLHGEWCKKIFDGLKTVEVRKTKPRLEPPFTVYIYCTRPNKNHQTFSDKLFRLPDGTLKHDWFDELMFYPSDTWGEDNFLNGNVIGEVTCDKITQFQVLENGCCHGILEELDKSCLSPDDIAVYIGAGKTGYAWHLVEPVLYDKPKRLSDFQHWVNEGMRCWNSALDRAPQSWCYVFRNSEVT